MSKVQVNIPAVITNLGAGPHTLGLALSLHAHLEMRTRADGQLKIKWGGEGAENAPPERHNPVLRAASRIFQQHEKAPSGLEIGIQNYIPLNAGLHVEAALLMGGIIAANNLIEADLDREDIIQFATQLGVPRVVALSAMLGGLNLCLTTTQGAQLHQSLEPPPLKALLIAPHLPNYPPNLIPQVSLESALYNMARMPFLAQAFVEGNLALLEKTLPDSLYETAYSAHIPAYHAAKAAAKSAGAAVVSIASAGPTLLIFAAYNHALIIDAVREVWAAEGIQQLRHWTLGLDAQGVTVSVLA